MAVVSMAVVNKQVLKAVSAVAKIAVLDPAKANARVIDQAVDPKVRELVVAAAIVAMIAVAKIVAVKIAGGRAEAMQAVGAIVAIAGQSSSRVRSQRLRSPRP